MLLYHFKETFSGRLRCRNGLLSLTSCTQIRVRGDRKKKRSCQNKNKKRRKGFASEFRETVEAVEEQNTKKARMVVVGNIYINK